ncbi:MAG: DUF190 domain-containing protein [Thermoleophilaceae bacterium]
MNADCLKLTTYFGERDRTDGRFLADALLDLYEDHGFATSVLLRGTEGFGARHRLQTQRLLTLSEDLPLVTVAVDTRERIQAAVEDVKAITGHGLVTLERARLLTGAVDAIELPEELHDATKLTIYCGRQERANGAPAFVAIVDLLRRSGIFGATVMLGVDGTARGTRQRARFFARNAEVPLMIIAVGDGPRVARVLPELGELLRRPLITLERVRVCKRDGSRLAEPSHVPAEDDSGMPVWQKLMVHSSEHARHAGRPLHVELIHRLREAEVAGATSLRAIWGYHGDHRPHGDRLLALSRRVPVLTVVVDRPEGIRRAFSIVDEVTADTGLVTSEMVPAARAASPHGEEGALRLARPS